MRVGIADDSALFREGIPLLLESAGVDVVCQAATGSELLTRIRVTDTDAVILDIRMPPTYTDEGIGSRPRSSPITATPPTFGMSKTGTLGLDQTHGSTSNLCWPRSKVPSAAVQLLVAFRWTARLPGRSATTTRTGDCETARSLVRWALSVTWLRAHRP